MAPEQKVQAEIGLVGLAVMGCNLVLNMNDHGFPVAVWNRNQDTLKKFMAQATGRTIYGATTPAELVAMLKRPRRIILLIKAGPAVDQVIEQLLPHMEAGDILIDGGNSNFADTARRMEYLQGKGLLYVGSGVSGGEEGARNGPSLMPGGSPDAWPHIKPIFQAIAAHVDDNKTPCCDWVGQGGAGHYVKMVHNGIEYGDMQIICEAYSLLRSIGMAPADMAKVFTQWNKGDLDSYLIEITADILGKTDDKTGRPMVDVILDTAGQKGTGKWTVISSCELGAATTLIAEAVFARCLSAAKDERMSAAKVLRGPDFKFSGDGAAFVQDVGNALYASKICSYAQGFALMRAAAAEYKWDLNYAGIATMWRGGCIIRSRFLTRIRDAFDRDRNLVNLLLVDYFRNAVSSAAPAWRRVIAQAVAMGVPVPSMGSALAYFDGYRSERLPANLLQAQRDYFGAHTYERTDAPRGQFFHTNWTGEGGTTTAGTYTA